MRIREEAERYCALIENADALERDEFVLAVASSLVALYSAALELPGGDTKSEIPSGPSIEECKRCFGAVQETLRDWDAFRTTITPEPPHPHAATAIVLPVAGALVSIWSRLKEGLLALERGEDSSDVVWWWRFSFYTEWGGHAADALRALHPRLSSEAGFVTTDRA